MSHDNNAVQSLFFEQVRKKMPPNLSFADELAEILSISKDSAYRRIRGETPLSLDEVKRLCEKFDMSLDAIIGTSPGFATFRYRVMDKTSFSINDWLSSILQNLTMLPSKESAELLYFAKDLPIFYYFNCPLLSSFKIFFWMHSLLHYDQEQALKFDPNTVPKELTSLGQRIYDRYTSIKRTEIWSEETLNVTLRQIEFYQACGFLGDSGMGVRLCEEYLDLLNLIRKWAGVGYTEKSKSPFELYKNDILIADNTILFRIGDRRIAFIPNNTFNILSTTNEIFCKQTDDYLGNLIRKSIKISTTGEKERHIFFNQMEEKIRKTQSRLL